MMGMTVTYFSQTHDSHRLQCSHSLSHVYKLMINLQAILVVKRVHEKDVLVVG